MTPDPNIQLNAPLISSPPPTVLLPQATLPLNWQQLPPPPYVPPHNAPPANEPPSYGSLPSSAGSANPPPDERTKLESASSRPQGLERAAEGQISLLERNRGQAGNDQNAAKISKGLKLVALGFTIMTFGIGLGTGLGATVFGIGAVPGLILGFLFGSLIGGLVALWGKSMVESACEESRNFENQYGVKLDKVLYDDKMRSFRKIEYISKMNQPQKSQMIELLSQSDGEKQLQELHKQYSAGTLVGNDKTMLDELNRVQQEAFNNLSEPQRAYLQLPENQKNKIREEQSSLMASQIGTFFSLGLWNFLRYR